MLRKKLPIGISDFSKIITDNYYYIDKSLLIKEIIDDGSEVILLPRPRRFGKTLNMTMLKCFFEKTESDNSSLFTDLQIWREEAYRRYCGQYPVIYLSFKDIKMDNWPDAYQKIQYLISEEYNRHSYLLDSPSLAEIDKKYISSIINRELPQAGLELSLGNISHYLSKHTGQKAVILIDEYDTPIQSGYIYKYFDKVINFMRNFFSAGLKDNSFLEKGVLTGILRIAKENLFSGLNNLNVYTILNRKYSDKFGLLEDEVNIILNYYEITYSEEVKNWYNGYVFGDYTIFNPWSIINYCDKKEEGLCPHWVNTSNNDLVREIITHSGQEIKDSLAELLKGQPITKIVKPDLVFNEIEKDTQSIWSFLFFCGYLKLFDHQLINGRRHCQLMIPNQEVKWLYEEIITGWFNESISNEAFHRLLTSLTNGDIETFEEIFARFVTQTFSYFDASGEEPEKLYHGFVLGLLISLNNRYEVKSNKDSGYGRYDVMLIPKTGTVGKGIIFEFKSVSKRRKETLETAVEAALQQIETKQYRQELVERGVREIIEIGIAFAGKEIALKGREVRRGDS